MNTLCLSASKPMTNSRIRDLVGSTNRERQGVVEADTTYVDPSTVGVHNGTNYDYLFAHILILVCHCDLIFSMNVYVKVFSTLKVKDLHYENMPIQIY